MSALKAKATALADRIAKFVTNAKKTGEDKRTETFLTARLHLLESYWKQFQSVHDEMVDTASAEDLQDTYFVKDVFSDVECAFIEATCWLSEQLKPSTDTPNNTTGPIVTCGNQPVPYVKLPKINLPTFTGAYLEWPSFRDTDTSLIHENTSLSDIQKMHYLKSTISGDAGKLFTHLAVTSANYAAAWEMLTSRYENKRLLVHCQLNALMSVPNMTLESPNEIRRVLDSFNQALRALQNLGRPIQEWNDWLVFVLSNKLEQSTRKDWETSIDSSTSLPTLDSLRTFLESRLHTLDALKGVQSSERRSNQSSRFKRPVSHSHHTTSTKGCIGCHGKHILLFCPNFRAKSIPERIQFVKSQRLCVNCLKANHFTSTCPSTNRCKHCNQKHHTMLHIINNTTSPSKDLPETNDATSASIMPEISPSTSAHLSNNIIAPSSVLLATAVVRVQASNGRTVLARALLDQGSQSSFITTSLANLLQLPKKKIRIPVLGVGGCEAGVAKSLVTPHIISTINSSYTFSVHALVLPTLTNLVPSQRIIRETWEHISDLQLADPNFHVPSSIDLILGADCYAEVLLNDVRHGPLGSPVAQNTSLGWILSGAVHRNTSTINSTVSLHCSAQEDLGALLRRFWEINEPPSQVHFTPDDEECENIFTTTHRRTEDGRYIVRLPLKSSPISLGDSRKPALAALLRMERRFTKEPELHKLYTDFMEEYKALNHMELVSDESQEAENCYYLPHHAVLKPSSTTTKLRVVFNASQRTCNGTSLNDNLHTGPKLQNDVSTVIMNWRIYPFVLSADIEKMYRQILVERKDTDLQRILWRCEPSEPIRCYRLLTVTYGTACAPYLACRILQQLADDYQSRFPLGATILRNNLYVDDALFGAFDSSSALRARNELRSLLQLGGFRLRKWLTNFSELLADLPDEDKESPASVRAITDEQFKTLGICWNPSLDNFSFQLNSAPVATTTKRSVLSDISRLYDPLGWRAMAR